MGGSIRRDGVCRKFGDFLESTGLQDFDFNGPKFTWKRGMLHQRIALCMGNDAWSFSCVNHLALIGSDHRHILLMGAVECHRRLPSSFKYIVAWQDEPSFKSMLEGCWSFEHEIAENLEMFTKAATDWNRDTFGNIGRRKTQLLARITSIEKRFESHGTDRLFDLERDLKCEFDDVFAQEESLWFQRSRSRWIRRNVRDGDRNTRFYHQVTKARQKRRNVTMIKFDDGG
ncbi:hypothetical protein V6N13_118402 [Hibiscus sabdariffa]